jgi:glycosidase
MGEATDAVYFQQLDETLHFGNDLLELRIDQATGRWRELIDRRDGEQVLYAGETQAPILLSVGGHTQVRRGYNQIFTVADAETIGLHWQFEGADFVAGDSASWLTVQLQEGDWHVELRYGLRPGLARIERTVDIRYEGDGEALLRHFTLSAPVGLLGGAEDCRLEAPGYAVRPGRRAASLLPGSWSHLPIGAFCDAPAWHPPLLGMHSPATNRTLLFWAYTETEPFYPTVDRNDQGLVFGHRVYLADRFTRGHRLQWGTQYLEVHHAPWLAALETFPDFYEEVGLRVPTDVPDWARFVDMYEVHVGTLAGNLTPYSTYEALIADLPTIRDKGFDVLYIMPHVPYPGYAVIDYRNMEVQQGSESGFRAFIQAAHALGMKVFMDVTMHGVMDRRLRRKVGELEGWSPDAYPMEPSMPEEHPYVSEHPEWFSRTETGEIAITYTYSFDHANASWQDFIADVFCSYVRDYDVDGFRVDSHTWNFFPNWARDLPYPASRSFYGSAALFTRVLRELQAIKPEVVLYTETAGPLLHGSHALGYNYDETWMLLSMLPVRSHRGMQCHFAHPSHVTTERLTAQDMAQWLAQRRLVMPRGAIKVHHLDCHDTYWPTREFRRETFGVEAARAVVALFAFIDGGFMDYNGADEGSEAFYRRVMHLRRTLPTLKEGDCDFLAVRPTDPMVFAPLRIYAGHALLPVIHFADQPTRVELPLPVERLALPADAYEVYDHMANRIVASPDGGHWSRQALTALELDLEPYAVLLLEFRPAKT